MPPVIALLTDFGLEDTYVGAMKGVIAGIAPRATVIDLTHAVPPQDVQAAAFALLVSYQDFPADTVFCCVVDPEVGSGRDALALELGGYAFVFPDNGLLTPLLEGARAARAVRLDDPRFHHRRSSATFHGRDIFAPAAAHLAAGTDLGQLGSSADPSRLRRLEWPRPEPAPEGFRASVIHVDRFGNLVTNLPGDLLGGSSRWRVRCGATVVERISPTFAAVARGQSLAYVGSAGFLELAVREGSAAQAWGVRRGEAVTVSRVAAGAP